MSDMVVNFHSKNIEKKREKREKTGKSLQKVARAKKQSSRSKSQIKQERYWDSNLEATYTGYALWNVVEWTELCRYYSQNLDSDFDFESESESESNCLNSYSGCSYQSDSESHSESESNYNEKYSYLLNRKSIDFESDPNPVKQYVLCDIHQPIVTKCNKCTHR